jgi:hypothetical protein
MKLLFLIIIFIGLTQVTEAQVTTCLPCDQLGMSVNVGSDTNSLSIYHSGQYLTHPQEHNTFEWNITDHSGNVIFQETIIDNAFCNFSHNFPISDTMNVIVYLINENAILPNGNSIHCMFEDQIYWETGVYPSGTPWGRWEFVYGNVGIDMNNVAGIEHLNSNTPTFNGKMYDLLGKEIEEVPIGQLYIHNGKKMFRIH